MQTRLRFSLVAAALFVLALAACSDNSSSPGSGTTDTTPPTVTTVTPVDAYHVDVTFSEQVTAASAQDESHYTITPVVIAEAAASRAQGGLAVTDATLKNDKKTVALTTNGTMSGLNFNLVVTGVSDTHGNDITTGVSKPFTGSDTPDTQAPQIIEKSPAAGATNVAIGTTVTIKFSEPLNESTFTSGVAWTSGAGPVNFTISNDGTLYTLTQTSVLGYNQLQTISLTGVQDPSGNTLVDTEWSFTTSNVIDHTPPTLVSTSPNNLAANVDVNTNLSITFSEAIDQSQSNVVLTPDPGEGVVTWSNGGKTITFDPVAPLLTAHQYTLTIYPFGVKDLAGNGILGLHTVVFTTGSYLAFGSIAGTITGDAGGPAADPTGATVFAADGVPFGNSSFNILGSTKVTGANTYSILYLPDGFYYLISILDTSGNGNFDPGEGDAIGAYGVNFGTADVKPDSVVIDGGTHATGINFTLLDPSAISGTVTYTGVQGDHPILVGIFSSVGFDPNTATPLAGSDAVGTTHAWGFNTLDQPIPDGNYYVGAFMDVNGNQNYDPATEPAGFYGGLPTPTVIHVTNGADTKGVVIPISDPAATFTGGAAVMAWPAAKHNANFQRLCDAIRQNQLQASR